MGALKGAGALALWIGLIIAITLIAMLFFSGVAYVSEAVIPWLIDAAWIALALSLLVLFPLSFFRATRPFSCMGFLISSYAFGICGWVFGFLVTYSLWGFAGVLIGLFIFGIGVVPVAIVAAIFHGSWETVWQLLALVALTFGARGYASYLATKADHEAYERSIITLEAK